MAAKLKLQRVGTKNQPKYRLVVQETRTKLGGKVVEILGEYNPRLATPFMNFKQEKVEKWLKLGVQMTDKVRFLLGKSGILPAVDTSKLSKKKSKQEQPVETAPTVTTSVEKPAPAAEAPEAQKAKEEAK